MSHLSIYFTRGTPRSTTPAFTLDFSKEPYLETLAERLHRQYTYGVAQPSQAPGQEQPGNFVTHGHTAFGQSETGWVAHDEGVVGEESFVTPTFTAPKPSEIPLTNGQTSSVAHPVTQRAPPLGSSTPAKDTTVPPKATAVLVNAAEVSKGTPTPVNAARSSPKPPAPVASTKAPQVSSVSTTASTQTGPAPVNVTKPPRKPPAPVTSASALQESSANITVPSQAHSAPLKAAEASNQKPAPANGIKAPQAAPATVNIAVIPRVAPQGALPISREKSTKVTVPSSARQEDLRISVAVSNANRTHAVKTQLATQLTRHASNKATKPVTSLQIPDSSMSSSEWRPSSPSSVSSPSSRSPTPKSPTKTTSLGRRRSTRSRAEPVTYNLYELSGISRRHRGPHDSHSDREDTPVFSGSPPPQTLSRLSLQQRQPSQPHQAPQARPFLQDLPIEIQTERGPSHKANLSSLLRTRELRGARHNHDLMRAAVSSNLKEWKSWKGLSNDVSSMAWSPDSTKFVVGATAHDDQYNRRNNLVFGDISKNTVSELPDHHILWESHAATADERLFPTVCSIQWVDKLLYTASYDGTVKVWNTDLCPSKIPICSRTLKHDSNVRVMSVSDSMPHLVATGTAHSFNLWNLQTNSPMPKSLEIYRDPRQKVGIVLEPTVLAWGPTAATKNYLVGGMAEYVPGADHDDEKKFQVVALGHLGMWKVTESSIMMCKLRGAYSQNTFDLKWHPSLPRFATGSRYSQGMNLPLRSKSAVQIFNIESADRVVATHKFACSAADMNEVTFCPMDSTYVTASCTDGSTYVWDARYGDHPIHKLNHGSSLKPLNPRFARELTDFGVRVALWGTTIDQFYTGSSDGCLKRWDIRRATEDALVANTAQLPDGIVSGAFSADKSQLLLGDYGGGIHVLSCEVSKHGREVFDFIPAPEPPSAEENAVSIAQQYLSSGQLTLHPIFGPVQGPQYNGPYALFARGLEDPTTPLDKIKRTPLLSEFQIQQFDGPPLDDRQGLDPDKRRELQCHFNIARARNARRGTPVGREKSRKRKRDRLEFGGIEKNSHTSSASPTRKKKKKKKKDESKKRRYSHVITRIEDSIIDLTMDSDSEMVGSSAAPTSGPTSAPTPAPVTATVDDVTMNSGWEALEQSLDRPPSFSPVLKVLEEESDGEDYWWPDSRDVDANLKTDDL